MSKPTIYFIPGTMCDQRLWQPLWEQLQKTSLITPTLIHLTIPTDKTIDKIVAYLATQIINNDSYLVGFSLGGYLASVLALNYPHKVKQLLLISTMSSALANKELKERTRTIDWIKVNGYTSISLRRIHAFLHANACKNQNIVDVIKAMDSDLGEDVLLHQLTVTTQRKNLLPKLAQLTIPVTFCIGVQDKIADLKKITAMTSSSKNIIIHPLNETGHMLPLEQPILLAEIIKNWINQ
ncbi:MAG: 2-succinyl-6-hydroxy-2,4-cyclohexadiene-1-carboxylate synthase [Alteromonadaceae bacterium]|jgi:2-succinyl-6-hydroxy-2,4-cyclohexadiene-1-carboxylate synthase